MRILGIWLRFGLLVAVLLLGGCGRAEQRTRPLTILHTNDLHARFLPDARGRGGFAQLATAIRREKRKAAAAIVLDDGDIVQGSPVSSIYEGVPCYEMANLLGLDVSTLGNHEFDYTWRRIPEFIATAKFPIVNANVIDASGKPVTGKPYVILERGGVRVAVIGALMQNLKSLTREYRIGPWKLLPVAETVRRYAREVRGRADLVVVLGHLFDEEESAILRTVPEVNLIVGGHDHRGLQRVKQVDGRLLVKVRAYGVELGRLDLEVDVAHKKIASFRWTRIPITTTHFPADPAMEKLVNKWESKVSELVDVRIGTASRAFDQDRVKKLIETAMREAVGADLSYMNKGGVRASLPKGVIRVRDVWNAMPFDDAIAYGKVKGRELPTSLRHGRRIDPERTYLVATNDYTAEQWSRRLHLGLTGTGPLVREALIDYIKERKVIR